MHRPHRLQHVATVTLVLLAFLVVLAPASARTAWPPTSGDLKPDPALRFGVLGNGMRYVLRRNANPSGTLSMRMRIEAGSLHERDNERGVAHYLEHMAFNGSQNYPEGEMFKALQRMGIQIGVSANAATGYDATEFSLSLPSVRGDVLTNGFSIMREIVGRLTLSAEAVERERGVILSEERARDTPAMRAVQAELEFWFRGQRYAVRSPMGDTGFVRKATPAQLRSFYERHYRPERALLVVVGDVSLEALEARVKQVFADWRPAGAPVAAPRFDKPVRRGLSVQHLAAPALEEMASITWVQPEDVRPDSAARRREANLRLVAFTVLNRRLSKIARQADAPFIAAEVNRQVFPGGGVVTSLTIRTKDGAWQRGVAAAEQALRQALVHGLQQSEVEREALEQRSPFLLASANTNNNSNMEVAEVVLDAVSNGHVPVDARGLLDSYTRSIADIRAAEVTAVLRASVSGAGPLVHVSAPRPIAGGDAAIRSAYQKSQAVAVVPPPKDEIKAFTYRDFGPAGQVTEKTIHADLGVTQVSFANGVRLNIKPTDFEKDKVSVLARLPGGQLSLPQDKPGLAWVIPYAFVEGGLGRLEMGELEQTEPGHFAGINMDVDEDKFQLSGETVERDVLLQLQVLAAFVTDPAWRPDGLARLQDVAQGQYQDQAAKPLSVLNRELPGLVRSGDARWAGATPAQIRSLTMADVKAALAPALARAPIEVTIVGHVRVQDAIEATAKTFGALAPRDLRYKALRQPVAFPREARALRFTHAGRKDQAAVASVWPGVSAFADPQARQAVAVLSEILQLRLIDEVRERQGGTYTPFGGSHASPAIEGYGYVLAGVEPKPEAADLFFETLGGIVKELRDSDVSPDLLDRARRPLLYQTYAAQTTNAFWLEVLRDAHAEPRALDEARSVIDDISGVTPADVRAAARRVLDDSRRLDIRVLAAP